MSDEPTEKRSTAKRKASLRRKVSYAVAILATLALVAVIFTKSRLLSYQVSSYVNDHYLANSPFEFSCGRISGDLVHRVVIKKPELRYNAPNASFAVFRADEIAVDYSIFEVVKLNLVVESLSLRGVRLQIRKDESGGLVLPFPGSDRASGDPRMVSPKVDIQRFHVAGLSLRFGDVERELAVRDVDLDGSFSYHDGAGRLRVDRGSALLADTGTPISEFQMDVRQEGKRLSVRDGLVRLERSLIMASGEYESGELDQVRLVFNPVSIDELRHLRLVGDVAGEFGGNVVMSGPLDSLRVAGSLSGTGFDVALTGVEFEGTLANAVLSLDRVKGDVFGTHVDGAFRVPLSGPTDLYYDGRVDGLDLTQGFIPDRGLPVTLLNGQVRLDHRAAAGTYDVVAQLDSSSLDGYVVHGADLSLLWTDGRGLDIRRAILARRGYTMDVKGLIAEEGGVFDVVLEAEGDDLSYFWDYFDLPRVDASVAVTARLTGPPEDMRINLNGTVSGVEFLFAGIDSGAVQAELLGVGSETPSVQLDVSGRRGHVADAAIFEPRLYLEVDRGPAHVRSLTFARGDTTFSTSFDVEEVDGTTEVLVRHAAVLSPFETWTLQSPALVRYNSGEVYVDSLLFVSPGGSVGGFGEYSEDQRRCDLHLWGDGADLAVLHRALDLPFPLAGRSTFVLDATGDVSNPNVTLHARVTDGVADSVSFDTLDVSARFDGRSYVLDRFCIDSGGDSLTAAGSWAYQVSPVNVARYGLSDDASRRAMVCTIDAGAYPLPSILRALHLPPWIGGAFAGTAELRGSPAAPTIEVRGRLHPRAGAGMSLPPTDVALVYDNGLLTVDHVTARGQFDATITGSVPMQLSLVDGLVLREGDQPSLSLTIAPSSLGPLAAYVPGVDVFDGRIEGKVRMGGTIASPRFAGALDFDGAELKLSAFDERYHNISGRIDFAENVIRLSSLSARTGEKGVLFATGIMELDGLRWRRYLADVVLQDFQLVSIPDFKSTQDGTLHVASTQWTDGRMIPSITGALEVKEAEMIWTFSQTVGNGASIVAPTDAPNWICSIDLSADNNAWIRNPDLNVEMSGNLILKRDQLGLYIRGDLTVLRGSYNIYGNKFHITDGGLNFSTVETLRPEVHINAYTPHRVEAGVEKRILLSLDWPQDKKEPTVQLTYDDPGYYESDLWRMLGGSSLAGGIAANALERALNQQMSGLTIEIEQRDTGRNTQPGDAEQEMVIGVGKYLWDDFYLKYQQGLTLASEQAIQVEYRMSRLFLLSSEFIRNSRRGYISRNGQYADEFNLDVKLRWEY